MDMSSGRFSGHRRRALQFRATFAHRWAVFVRENFDSPEHAAMAFGVDGKTARNWWEGSHAPNGAAVGWAHAVMPGPARALLGPDGGDDVGEG